MVQRASPLCTGGGAHVALRAQPASRRSSPHRPRGSPADRRPHRAVGPRRQCAAASRVATRRRDLTQPQALGLYRRGAAGIRWWSTFESLWTNLTVFDRVADRLRVREVRRLGVDDPAVREAADVLGIAPA